MQGMTEEEALALVEILRDHGIELRQRGRVLRIERGEVGPELRDVIGRNWTAIAAAVSVHRQAGQALAKATKAARRTVSA